MNTNYTILRPDPPANAGVPRSSHTRGVRGRFPFHRWFADSLGGAEGEGEHDGSIDKEQQLPTAILAQLSENPEIRAAALKIVTNMKV